MPDEALPASPDIGTIRQLLQALPVPSAVLDGPMHRILYVNPAFARFGGYSVTDMIGKSHGELWGGKLSDMIAEQDRAVIEGKRAVQSELMVPGSRARYARHLKGRKGVREFERQLRETVDEVARVCAEEGLDADLVKGGPLTAATWGLLVLGALKLIPWIGIWSWTAATLIGVGAALSTKFGRREPWFLVWRAAET